MWGRGVGWVGGWVKVGGVRGRGRGEGSSMAGRGSVGVGRTAARPASARGAYACCVARSRPASTLQRSCCCCYPSTAPCSESLFVMPPHRFSSRQICPAPHSPTGRRLRPTHLPPPAAPSLPPAQPQPPRQQPATHPAPRTPAPGRCHPRPQRQRTGARCWGAAARRGSQSRETPGAGARVRGGQGGTGSTGSLRDCGGPAAALPHPASSARLPAVHRPALKQPPQSVS